MGFKRRVLLALGKHVLLAIGRRLELAVTTRMRVQELRDALAKSKRANLATLVQEPLSRATLKETTKIDPASTGGPGTTKSASAFGALLPGLKTKKRRRSVTTDGPVTARPSRIAPCVPASHAERELR